LRAQEFIIKKKKAFILTEKKSRENLVCTNKCNRFVKVLYVIASENLFLLVFDFNMGWKQKFKSIGEIK
jgi:hypothetical protein